MSTGSQLAEHVCGLRYKEPRRWVTLER